MDLALITNKVQKSHFLTDAERSYWLEHLPTMTEAQIKELDDILTQAAQIQVDPENEHYKALVVNATAALV